MKKHHMNKWSWFILGLLVISGYLLYWTNIQRVAAGYFEDGMWIFWNTLAYVVFFGLLTGFVIGRIVSRAK